MLGFARWSGSAAGGWPKLDACAHATGHCDRIMPFDYTCLLRRIPANIPQTYPTPCCIITR
jgi:hypothetical protein